MVSEGVFKIDELIHKIKTTFGMVTLIGTGEDMIIETMGSSPNLAFNIKRV